MVHGPGLGFTERVWEPNGSFSRFMVESLLSQPRTAAVARVFDREAYKDRNVVERCVGWLKEPRRIVTRFEKLAVNFLAMVKIAMIERLFRIGLSDGA